MTHKSDRDRRDEIIEMKLLGDPNWRNAALSHIRAMMKTGYGARTVAAALKMINRASKKS